MRDIFQLFTMLAIHQASHVHRLWVVCLFVDFKYRKAEIASMDFIPL